MAVSRQWARSWAAGLALALSLSLALGVSLAAQGRSGGGGRGGVGGRRGPPPPDANTQALVEALYSTARDGIGRLPTLAAPMILVDLARDEEQLFPAQAIADDTTAFNLARALPMPAAADPGAAAIAALKARVELDAVSAIARQRSPTDAANPAATPTGLQAARRLAWRADVPKAPLYDVLLPLAMQSGGGVNAVLELALECARSDGSYPYRGVAAALRRPPRAQGRDPGDDASARLRLASAALSYLGQDTDASDDSGALFFLQMLRREMPGLAPQVESALSSLITSLGQSPDSDAAALTARATALLDALQTGSGSAPEGWRGRGFGAAGAPAREPATVTFAVTVSAQASDDTGQWVGTSSFLMWVNRAQALERSAPGAALAAANQAAAMLDSDLLASALTSAGTLAAVYNDLGATADAQHVLQLCLDAADEQGVAADQRFAAADTAMQAAQLQRLDAAAAPILDVYRVAARLAPASTELRAANSPMVLYKPLLLSRLALLAQFPAGRRGLRVQ